MWIYLFRCDMNLKLFVLDFKSKCQRLIVFNVQLASFNLLLQQISISYFRKSAFVLATKYSLCTMAVLEKKLKQIS
jgi:hypothetical protein